MNTSTLEFRVDEQLCSGCGLCVSDCVTRILALDGQGHPAIIPGQEAGCLLCQHCMAICPKGAIAVAGRRPQDSLPLTPEALPSLAQMDLLVRARRSVRQYRDTPVDPALITRMLQSLEHAPTGVNCRRLTFTVVQGQAAMDSFRAQVTERLASALASGEFTGRNATLAQAQQERDVIFRGAPHLLLVSAPPDSPCPQQDVSLALAYFELLAQSAGLGTLWLGYLRRIFEAMPDLKALLGVPADHVYYAMLFGYPAVRFARTVQREGTARIRRMEALPA